MTVVTFTQKKPPETERKIRVNDGKYNASFRYANNYITTAKYNVFTFIPKNLFEQFQRVANMYFLLLLILQLLPEISSVSPLTTVFPLVIVLSVSAVKDAIDDFQRHSSDRLVNNRLARRLRGTKLVEERWKNVVAGDVICLKNGDFVPADMLLLSTSQPSGLGFIETSELDGEMNLKVRTAISMTVDMRDDGEQLSKFTGEIRCDGPNTNLYKFEGVVEWREEKVSLNNDMVLLRGCIVRNTEWCYGAVIYAGVDTKLMMNCGTKSFKRTNVELLMNRIIIGIILVLLLLCCICVIGCGIWSFLYGYKFQVFLPWSSFVPGSRLSKTESTYVAAGSTVEALLVFFSYIILFNTLVPISLYVCVEVVRFGHSWYINWDNLMLYRKTGVRAQARTTTLNEELGQINYIFSDKTGTLTQNIMTFVSCSINGRIYGRTLEPRKSLLPPEQIESPLLSDTGLMKAIAEGNQHVHTFLRLLALCHTVMSETQAGKMVYQAQSPDENALVTEARDLGFVFKSRSISTVTIKVLGHREVYNVLCILDFNSVRKRMSIILEYKGVIRLYCKGADATVLPRIHPQYSHLIKLCTAHLNTYAENGLRTLCLAVKDISEAYYADWKKRHHAASIALGDRDDQLSRVYDEIETDMDLVGVTAIEDKLQDDVPQTIANLALAGIRIWVLTGDKQETAINIGHSCRLLTKEMAEIFFLDGHSHMEVEEQMLNIQKEMVSIVNELLPTAANVEVENIDAKSYLAFIAARLATAKRFGGFALVINGHSLVFALTPELELQLLEIGRLCKAVIVCRATPLQKALVVDLFKRYTNSLTLAVGDGANDVGMIERAHIGVGIHGQEGMQAVFASDYSIAQFAHLQRLLFVHGRWSYLRISKFLTYFFYKNIAFTLCHFWFAFFCGFSAQTIFDEGFIAIYNVVFTSLPVLALGLFDQDVNDVWSVRYPRLYVFGMEGSLFNVRVFLVYAVEAVATSLVIFFVPYFVFANAARYDGITINDSMAFGIIISTALVVVVTLRCALEMMYWTVFTHLCVWGSVVVYFSIVLIAYSNLFHYSFEGVSVNVMLTGEFWLTQIIVVLILLLPVVAVRFYCATTHPSLTERVRWSQRYRPRESRLTAEQWDDIQMEEIAKTKRRHSRLSQQRGYAFSHQEGFGDLIMNGKMGSVSVQSDWKSDDDDDLVWDVKGVGSDAGSRPTIDKGNSEGDKSMSGLSDGRIHRQDSTSGNTEVYADPKVPDAIQGPGDNMI